MSALGAPIVIERKSMFEWISYIFFLVAFGYFVLVSLYTVFAISLVRPVIVGQQVISTGTLGRVVLAANIRSTFPAFLRNFERSDPDILQAVQQRMEKRAFISHHVMIHLLTFLILGFIAGAGKLYHSALIVPPTLFISTYGLIFGEVLLAQTQHPYTAGLILLEQLFCIYAAAVVTKWMRLLS